MGPLGCRELDLEELHSSRVPVPAAYGPQQLPVAYGLFCDKGELPKRLLNIPSTGSKVFSTANLRQQRNNIHIAERRPTRLAMCTKSLVRVVSE